MVKTCILTIIKNEQEYLDEWLKYHLELGIDHIFIFEDIDSESHKDICDKYGDKVSLNGVFDILEAKDKERVIELKRTKASNPQYIYIKKGLSYVKNVCMCQYKWCFVIDNDEFITLGDVNSKLEKIVSLYQNYDAFIMSWKCYGANGLINKPDYTNKGIIDTYTEEIQGYIPTLTPQSLTKTCYNLDTYQEKYFLYTHQPSRCCKFCRTNFETNRNKVIYDNIYIRHYITKSWEEYVWKRTKRGFLYGKIRDYDFFFKVNPDMEDKKEELIKYLEKQTLVILPYKGSASQGNEIKLALRGWKKFCTFNYHFIVIGEYDEMLPKEFPWVEFIFCPQIAKKDGQYNQHLDVQHCMEVVMNKYYKVYDGFIWMVDDNYPIKSFQLEDITTIHYHSSDFNGNEKSPASYWSHDKWKTKQLLLNKNLPHVNYTTHYPCYFEFKKLKKIWDKFDMRNESYVLEDVYFNYYNHEETVLDSKIRLGIWHKDIFKREFQDAILNSDIKFVCNSVEGWSEELEEKLTEIIG